jgi:hypothetical protein
MWHVWGKKNVYKIFWGGGGNLKVRNLLNKLGVDGKAILKCGKLIYFNKNIVVPTENFVVFIAVAYVVNICY